MSAIVQTTDHPTGVDGVTVRVQRREYEAGHFTNDVYIHEKGTARIWFRACGDKLLSAVVDKLARAIQAREVTV